MRLGHGFRIADDIATADDGAPPRLGRLAAYVRDRQVALELCPTSNVHIGAVTSVAATPVGLLMDLGFRVTVNTDNRLMSGVTASSELAAVDAAFGLGVAGLERLAVDALEASFLPLPERRRLVDDVVRPGYARLTGQQISVRQVDGSPTGSLQ